MAQTVEVVPAEFHLVHFDPARIAAVVERVAAALGWPAGAPIRVEVDERSTLPRVQLRSSDPAVIGVGGGAFEDQRRPRQLSEEAVEELCGQWLLRAADRRDHSFVTSGALPPEAEVTLAQSAAWNAYCSGRAERRGVSVRPGRSRYHFRVRHGFSDVADAVFDRLWSAEALGWADIAAASEEAAGAGAAGAAGEPGGQP